MSSAPPLPAMWAESVDQRTGRTYYYHILTSERTFERPQGRYDKRKVYDNSSKSGDGTSPITASGGSSIPQKSILSDYTATTTGTTSQAKSKSRTNSDKQKQQQYAYYTEEYQSGKRHKEDKSKRKGGKYDDDDDDAHNDSYGIVDSYSSDESSSSPSGDRHRSKKKSKREEKSSSRRREKRSKSRSRRHRSRDEDYDDDERDYSRSKSNSRSKSRDDRRHQKKKERREKKEKQRRQEDPEPEHRSKTTSRKNTRSQSPTPPPVAVAAALSSSRKKEKNKETKQQAKLAAQLEQARQDLEERARALKKREKELKQERSTIIKERKHEEQARKLQAALDEKARRKAFEDEEDKRAELIRTETKRQVTVVEKEARRAAREAEEGRRKAEEEAELARQRAAELDMARLQAEKEAQLAKRKAAKEEEARHQAVLEVQQVRQQANASKEEQELALKVAEDHMAVAEEKQIKAERKALIEEQNRLKEELKRQELEESIRLADLGKSNGSVVSDDGTSDSESYSSSGGSGHSQESSSRDESFTEASHEDLKEEGPRGAHMSMEDSIDLMDLMEMEDEPPSELNKTTATAREKKRNLENKYSSSAGTASTKNSSGTTPAASRDTSYQNSHNNSASITFSGNASAGNGSSLRRSRAASTPRQPTRSVSPNRSPQKGRQSLARSNSMDPSRRMDLARMNSRPAMGRKAPVNDFHASTFNPHESRLGPVPARGMARMQSVGPGRGMPNRAKSGRGMGDRAKSMAPMGRNNSMALKRANSRGSFDQSFSKYDNYEFDPNQSMDLEGRPKKKKIDEEEEEIVPKPLVLIWIVVAAELGFDMGTTVIAFRALTDEDDCCGEPINLGPVPMTITAPFFLLVSAELALLIRAILMTMFPNVMKEPVVHDEEGNLVVRSCFMRWFCCCLRWKVKIIMHFLGFLVLLNPFFGCFIAWILLYQSDKTESFMVLGFEGAAMFLHYISVYLEGSITGCWSFIMQGLVPLLPFTVGVGLVLFYLKQGGVCYIVEDQLFKFNGCEVCIDGYPPVDGICYLRNGTVYDFVAENVLRLDKIDGLEDITARTYQVSYCANENPEGPDTNFCFFDFEDGQLPGVVSNSTEAPTAVPVYSNNKCGGTVSAGDRLTQCRKHLWNPTSDESMHCITGGGPGDPCRLTMDNDGQNQGRFKDPSACTVEAVPSGYRAYGDTLYLWNDPIAFERSYKWAGNSWLAYSSARWIDQIEEMRSGGIVQVATPLVRYDSPEQLRTNMQEFFDGCKPNCLTPGDPSFIDVLSVDIFCDPDLESCAETVATATGALTALSEEFDSRRVHITSWGVPGTQVPVKLSQAMGATPGFFVDGSPVERVYWYGGDTPDATNLAFRSAEGSDKSLGDLWVETCNALN